MRGTMFLSVWQLARNPREAALNRPVCFGRAEVISSVCLSARADCLRQRPALPKLSGCFLLAPTVLVASAMCLSPWQLPRKAGTLSFSVSDWGLLASSASRPRKRRKGVTAKAGGRVGHSINRQPRLHGQSRQRNEEHSRAGVTPTPVIDSLFKENQR